jgi:Tfp pilus assembly protein FimT
MIVVVIIGIISSTVIPAMDNIRSMREGAARDDFVRMIEVVKGRAVASGMPRGLQVNMADSSLSMVKINEMGSIEVEFDPLTGGDRIIYLSAIYSGVSINSMTNGDGVSGSGIIWFDFESNPHTRESNGDFSSLNVEAAEVTLSSNERVIVYPYSGTLEVQ